MKTLYWILTGRDLRHHGVWNAIALAVLIAVAFAVLGCQPCYAQVAILECHDDAGYRYVSTAFAVQEDDEQCWITCAHSIRGTTSQYVLINGDRHALDVVYRGDLPANDVAVLKCERYVSPNPYRLADRMPVVGDSVVIAGYPHGRSTVIRTVVIPSSSGIQLRKTARGIPTGMSGAPVVKGKTVVGVFSAVPTINRFGRQVSLTDVGYPGDHYYATPVTQQLRTACQFRCLPGRCFPAPNPVVVSRPGPPPAQNNQALVEANANAIDELRKILEDLAKQTPSTAEVKRLTLIVNGIRTTGEKELQRINDRLDALEQGEVIVETVAEDGTIREHRGLYLDGQYRVSLPAQQGARGPSGEHGSKGAKGDPGPPGTVNVVVKDGRTGEQTRYESVRSGQTVEVLVKERK